MEYGVQDCMHDHGDVIAVDAGPFESLVSIARE